MTARDRRRVAAHNEGARHAAGSDPLSELQEVLRSCAHRSGAETVTIRNEPAQDGRSEPLPPDLPPALAAALQDRGIQALYRHQADAWRRMGAGGDVLLASGTASGKSLPAQLAIVSDLLRDPHATALALFPTKALAQDQAASLQALASAAGLPAGTVALLDGDQSSTRRTAARERARVLITNPDMLHLSVLPHHARYDRILRGLCRLWIDEAHAYRGVFGGHLAGVLRRLERLAGRVPTFLASATLGNPGEHAATLLGRPVHAIVQDAAPRPGRTLAVLRPPFLDADLGIRRPPLALATELAGLLADLGRQVLVFADSRQAVEEAVVDLRERPFGVRAYRSGLLPSERRRIERELHDGTARVVVATSALELGIDVGAMDAVICAGWPGSAAAFRQRIGRAGRADAPGAGVLVLGSGPLDAYLAQAPDAALGAPAEAVVTDPDHLLAALAHLRCAIFERPLAADERFGGFGPEEVAILAAQLAAEGETMQQGDGRSYWIGADYPAASVSLRNVDPQRVRLASPEGRTIGEVDGRSARFLAHPGAVYLHDGAPWRVEELDLVRGEARLAPADHRTVTRATTERTVTPVSELTARPVPGGAVLTGEVLVREQTSGYRVIERSSRRTLERHPLTLPPFELRTTAYVVAPSSAAVQRLRRAGRWGNDANDYGPDWPRTRAFVLARDAYACRACGASAAAAGPLHVHHRVPFRAFRDHRDANRPDNLATLCPACHRAAEAGVRIRSGLAAVAHLLRALAPLIAVCDRRDLGVAAEAQSACAEGGPALVVHETVPGGVGLCERLAAAHEHLVTAAAGRLRACPCHDGCPACVGPAGEEGHAGKDEAAALLAEWTVAGAAAPQVQAGANR